MPVRAFGDIRSVSDPELWRLSAFERAFPRMQAPHWSSSVLAFVELWENAVNILRNPKVRNRAAVGVALCFVLRLRGHLLIMPFMNVRCLGLRHLDRDNPQTRMDGAFETLGSKDRRDSPSSSFCSTIRDRGSFLHHR